MIIRRIIGLVVLAGTLAAAEKTQKVPPRIIAFAERPSAVYKIGEPVRFKVWMVQPKLKRFYDPEFKDVKILPGEPLNYELTGDGGFRKRGSIVTGNEVSFIEGALPRPGFLLLKLTSAKDKKIVRYAGAGVGLEKIVSGTKMPADFEDYWKKEIAKLRAVKPRITVREASEYIKPDTKYQAKIYDVRIEDGNINATGILTIPLYPGKKKLPAIITFGGASWIGASPRISEAIARGAMIFHMNIHDTKNYIANQGGAAALRRRPDIAGYQFHNLTEPDKYMPRTIFLRIIRSLYYLKSRPEWNGKDLIAKGPSFGGCQSIVAAALDKDVTLCLPGGPAMCDHLGGRNNQKAGWPQLLSNQRYRTPPEMKALAEKNSAYFESANMARLIRCPVVFSVGFIDTICPPTSVYAAYNNVPGNHKKMIHGVRASHGSSLLIGESGAFSAGDDPLCREVCRGKEMLINGSFDYRRNGKDGQLLPWGWECRDGVVKVMEHGVSDSLNPCFLRLENGARVFKNIYNLRRQAGKIVFEGMVRGNGKLSVVLGGALPPVTFSFTTADPANWQNVTHTYNVKAGSYALLVQLKAQGTVELDALSVRMD